MNLSRRQFEHHLGENKLVLSLIGMSNIGKSYWSRKLGDVGFVHLDCDGLIEERLAPALKKLGYSGIEDVARWMGRPYDERFVTNQQKYLSFEKETLETIFDRIQNSGNQNTVIDTTGSVVHTGKDTCARLRERSLVVYIEATDDMKEEMFAQYIKRPKPVVFGDVFVKQKNETAIEALERCYRKLLDARSALYTEYADVVIPYGAADHSMTADQFISLIAQSL